MMIRSRAAQAAFVVLVALFLAGAFAFGVYARRAGWDWTPAGVFAALAVCAAAGVLVVNSRKP